MPDESFMFRMCSIGMASKRRPTAADGSGQTLARCAFMRHGTCKPLLLSSRHQTQQQLRACHACLAQWMLARPAAQSRRSHPAQGAVARGRLGQRLTPRLRPTESRPPSRPNIPGLLACAGYPADDDQVTPNIADATAPECSMQAQASLRTAATRP